MRLNTNESPVAAAGGVAPRAGRGRSPPIDWHRYPDRAATRLRAAIGALHGVGPEQVFAANGSNEVLQTAAAHLRRPRPHRRRVGADLRAALPHRPPHRHRAWPRGSAAADFALDLDEVRRVVADAPSRRSRSCARPTTRPAWSTTEATVRAVLDLVAGADGLLVVDEAYGQFAPWSALELVDDDVPLVVTRTFSKTWSMAAARLGYLVGPRGVVAELEKVVLPYHLDALKQVAGRLALDYVDEMDARVARLVEERGRLVARLAELPVDVWPSGANFVLFRPARRCDGDERVAGAARPLGARARLLVVAPPRRLPAGHHRHPRRGRCASSPPWRRSCHERHPHRRRPPRRHRRPHHQRDRHRRRARPRRRRTGSRSTTGIPFFDHMLAQLGRHGGFDLVVRATGDLEIDAHHTVEDVGIALGEVFRRPRGRQGRACGASPPTGCPLDEALVDVALDLSGRPVPAYEVTFPGEKILGDPPFDPQLVEEFWRAFATAAGITLHVDARCGA